MKKTRLISLPGFSFMSLVFIVLNPNYTVAQSILWQPEQRVSFDSANLAGARVFAFGDTVHVFWRQFIQEGNKAFHIRSIDGGATFSSPRSV